MESNLDKAKRLAGERWANVSELDQCYIRLLSVGLNCVRAAVRLKNTEWAEAEAELLHEIPNLIQNPHWSLHESWSKLSRSQYVDWLATQNRDQLDDDLPGVYEPILDEIMRLHKAAEIEEQGRPAK